MQAPMIIGLAGGTGSGKTTVARTILDTFKEDCALIPQDAYYKDQTNLPMEERVKQNYDHPDAFDFKRLTADLKKLHSGQKVYRPEYCFVTHTRKPSEVLVQPKRIVVFEGILAFYDPAIRKMIDLMIFVDTDPDVRLIRRVSRDITERGRSLDSVFDQYLKTVKPMHEAFIEPTKKYAHIILPEGGFNRAGLEVLISRLRLALEGKSPLETEAPQPTVIGAEKITE